MKESKDQALFKKGVWIKEQQGTLTMGALDDESSTMVIPDTLSSKIFEFENDMIEALYGDDRVRFDPEILEMERVFNNLKNEFSHLNLRLSFPGSGDHSFKGSHDEMISLLRKLILSAVPDDPSIREDQVIYINASILENHLCVIFRDSLSISKPAKLKDEIRFLKQDLKGEISFKETGSEKTYYDIMIPSRE